MANEKNFDTWIGDHDGWPSTTAVHTRELLRYAKLVAEEVFADESYTRPPAPSPRRSR